MAKALVPEEVAPYRPPQKRLVPCLRCGCTVLRQPATGRNALPPAPQTPLGNVHNCDEALARWAPIQRYLAGEEKSTFATALEGLDLPAPQNWLKPAHEEVA